LKKWLFNGNVWIEYRYKITLSHLPRQCDNIARVLMYRYYHRKHSSLMSIFGRVAEITSY